MYFKYHSYIRQYTVWVLDVTSYWSLNCTNRNEATANRDEATANPRRAIAKISKKTDCCFLLWT